MALNLPAADDADRSIATAWEDVRRSTCPRRRPRRKRIPRRDHATAARDPRPLADPDDRPGPQRAAPDRDATGAAVRPRVRRRLRAGRRPAGPSGRRGPLWQRDRRLRVRDVRDLLGLDQLHLVRLGVRHRRLVLPDHHDGADGRRGGARAGHAAGLPLHRRGPHPRQPGRRRRLRDHADRDGGPVAAGREAGSEPSSGRAQLRGLHRGRPGRLGRAGRAAPRPRPDLRRGCACSI